MRKIIKLLTDVLTSTLMKVLLKAMDVVKEIFVYLNKKQDYAERTEQEAKLKDAEKELDNACDNGNLDDLFDSTRKLGKLK